MFLARPSVKFPPTESHIYQMLQIDFLLLHWTLIKQLDFRVVTGINWSVVDSGAHDPPTDSPACLQVNTFQTLHFSYFKIGWLAWQFNSGHGIRESTYHWRSDYGMKKKHNVVKNISWLSPNSIIARILSFMCKNGNFLLIWNKL